MLILRANTDDLELVTGSAGDIEVHLSAMQVDASTPPVVQPLPNLGPLASITTATTTQIVDTSGITNGHSVNVKDCSIMNNSSSVSNAVEVRVNDGTNSTVIAGTQVTLLPKESLKLVENGVWIHYNSDGIPKGETVKKVYNASTASQGAGFSSDTYLTGSFVVFPKAPKVGTKYKLKFDVSKTAAGTATPIVTVRVGTAGTTADTARHTLTFNAGTAAADVGKFELDVVFRSVGGGTSAVTQCRADLAHSLSTTGIINTPGQVLQSTSGGFDSTVSGLGIGVSVNGGASASWTVQLVDAEVENVD